MNILAVADFFDKLFANWQMVLFITLSILLLIAILFRKFKLTALIVFLIALATGAVLIVDLIVEATKWDLVDFADFAVRWVPTILFCWTVILCTYIGACRGLRKSLILVAHQVAAAVICIIVFAICVNLPAVDEFMLKFVNMFLGGSGSLESRLGVTAECSGLKDVFVAWLPTVIKGDASVMLSESKAYIYTLADLLYHVAFALLLYVVYLILDFILYIFYHCCYSERKYREKINVKYSENRVDRRYSKHRLGGSVVGLVRGVTVGLISMAFLGTALFVVAGRGEGKLKEYDFGDDDVNNYYEIYRSIDSYGTYGIFKVLNAISDKEDMPYYLFAADLVFSGELEDEELGISGNIIFREELGAYTGFAHDTMALLLKYGGDEIKPLINGTSTESTFDTIINVMADEGFRSEFNDLITEFDTKTYIINFASSFVNSAVAHIDDMSFATSVSARNKDLLKLLFTKGYLSDSIPDEREIKQAVGEARTEICRPYINVSKLVTKRDVQIAFNVTLDLLSDKDSTKDVLGLIRGIAPKISELSFFDGSRKEELDPVLGRLYCYAANTYLTEEGSEGVRYADIYADDIKWTDEINSLVDVADAALNLYDNVYESGKSAMDTVIDLFDKELPTYEQNSKYYDDICACLVKSKALGKALSTSYICKLIENALGSVFKDLYVPDNLVYENRYDAQGNIVRAGETYSLLHGVRLLGRNSDVLPRLKDLDKDGISDFLTSLKSALKVNDSNGKFVSDYISGSGLLRSVISAAMTEFGGDYVYVPKAACEKDGQGNYVNLVKVSEFDVLFDNFDRLVDFIDPILKDENADMSDAIADFVKDPVFENLKKDSRLFEGTVAKLLVKQFDGDQTVIIPKSLKDSLEGWVTSNNRAGELSNLLDSLDLMGIDVGEVAKGGFDQDKVVDNVRTLSDADLDKCLKSQVLHYTLSNFLAGEGEGVNFGTFTLVVPAAARQPLTEDSIPSLVKKTEITRLIGAVNDLNLSEETENFSSVFSQLVKHKDVLKEGSDRYSNILTTSAIYAIVSDADISAMLKLPENYAAAATLEELNGYNSNNVWKSSGELVLLVEALDEILEVDDSFTFNESVLEDKISSLFGTVNQPAHTDPDVSRLRVCYASEIVRNNITVRLDELLADKVESTLINGGKGGDGYYKYDELQSLSSALDVFGISLDLNESEGEEDIVTKVKNKVFNLNDVLPEYDDKTMLQVVYPSSIISGMLSKELDKALLENTDEFGDPDPLIDEGVLRTIKGGSSRYKQEEIAQLVTSVNLFGIDSIDNLDSVDYNTITHKTDQELDEICASKVVRGVFTMQASNSNTLGVDHPKAYESNVKILRSSEIKSIIKLIGSLNDGENIEDMNFEQLELRKVQQFIYNPETGKPDSYLLLKCASNAIIDSQNVVTDAGGVVSASYNFIVRDALKDSYGCINAQEVYNLIDAYKALRNDEDAKIAGWDGKFEYPSDASRRNRIFNSELACAKITESFLKENLTGEYCVGMDNLGQFTDVHGKQYIQLSVQELTALCDALDICHTEGFKIPASITKEKLREYKEQGDAAGKDYISILMRSDVIRYKVCDSLLREPALGGATTVNEAAYNLVGKIEVVKKTVSTEAVKGVLGAIS